MDQYFIYTACGTNKVCTREEAVAVVRDKCGLLVRIYPSATPVIVEVRTMAGLVPHPVVKVNGYGWEEPAMVQRVGRALVEAAAIAAEAQAVT